MDLVMNVADRVLVMDYGQHLFEGAPADVQKNPAVDRGLSRRRADVSALLVAERLELAYGEVAGLPRHFASRSTRARSSR